MEFNFLYSFVFFKSIFDTSPWFSWCCSINFRIIFFYVLVIIVPHTYSGFVLSDIFFTGNFYDLYRRDYEHFVFNNSVTYNLEIPWRSVNLQRFLGLPFSLLNVVFTILFISFIVVRINPYFLVERIHLVRDFHSTEHLSDSFTLSSNS